MGDSTTPAAELLDLVQQDPAQALRRARDLLVGTLADEDRVRARWAAGLAHRELGQLAAAERELRAANDLARPGGELAASTAMSLAFVLAQRGDVAAALAQLDRVGADVHGNELARLETQRGAIHYRIGELNAASASYERALAEFTRTGADPVAEARLRINIGALESYLGRLDRAREVLDRAVILAQHTGQRVLEALAVHNIAHTETMRGDLPAAFAAYAEAEERYVAADVATTYLPVLWADHARALLHGHLLGEARERADRALAAVEASETVMEVGEIALLVAEVHLLSGDLPGAREAAETARRSFASLQRSAWIPLATSVGMRVRACAGGLADMTDELGELAVQLRSAGYVDEAVRTQLLAAQAALAAGRTDIARERLRAVDARRGRAAERAMHAHVRGLIHAVTGDTGRARRAVTAGLRIVAANQASLGATDLRAHGAGHGEELAQLGARLAVAERRGRELLERVEAPRQMQWLLPRAVPPSDARLAELLAEVRVAVFEERAAASHGRPVGPSRVPRLERRIEDHLRRVDAARADEPLDVGSAIAMLGDHVLLSYADVDGVLYAVTAVDRRVHLHHVGPLDGIADQIEACTFMLHRLNRVQGSAASRQVARTTLRTLGGELGRRLVPPRVASSDRPLLIVPAGPLHGLAWGALAVLAGRPVSVAPSLIGWAVARRRTCERDGRAVLVAGPDLRGAASEVSTLAGLHRRSTVLTGPDATVAATLAAIDGSGIAHLACHGAFRSDNPLFSTLSLVDGPLIVHDLQRCRRVPAVVVLSACNAASSAVLRGGTLLGLAATLMAFGTATVVAPLTPVNDEAVVEVMVRLHRRLADGWGAAAALSAAATWSEGNPDRVAAAFVAFGV